MCKKVGFVLLFVFGALIRLPAQQEIDVFFESRKSGEQPTVIPGMFTTYRQGKEIFWEIPDSLFGRDMIVTTTILEGAAVKHRKPDKRYGYAGDLFGPMVVRFQKSGQDVILQIPLCDRIGIDASRGGIHYVAEQRGDAMLSEVLAVEARTSSSVLVDVTRMLMNNSLFNLNPYNFELMMGSPENAKNRIGEIKGFPENILIRSTRSFVVEDYVNGFSPPSRGSYTTTWEVGVCLALLPREPLERRLRNKNVGYFGFTKTDMAASHYALATSSIVKRWRMEPCDKEAYARGEMVEPVKPIVFYIDRKTPARWVPYFMEAVNAWQEAFERIGFKNAIRGELAPTLEENPDFSEYDTRYSFISWKVSPVQNAYGPSTVDPRTGEVITSHVGIFSSVWDLVQQWYFAQCGVVDEIGRELYLPDELLGELVKMVVTHEIGHTLGLEHNFLGSSLYTVEQLRDNDFLSQHGMGSSIMDYMRFNTVARKEDGISLKNRIARIGGYDRFAIEWGYRYLPGQTTRERNEWVEREQVDAGKRFRGGMDVRAQAEDLGNDHVAFNSVGIDNLKRLMDMSELWKCADRKALHVVKSRYEGVVNQYAQFVEHILQDIGGLEFSDEDTTRLSRPVCRKYMERVMDFLGSYVLTPCDWLYRDSLGKVLGMDTRGMMRDFYEHTLKTLVKKQVQVARMEEYMPEDAYTLRAYVDGLHAWIFKEQQGNVRNPESDSLVQKAYVEALEELVKKNNYVPARVLAETMRELERIRQKSVKSLQKKD